jgi:hypothetical protein
MPTLFSSANLTDQFVQVQKKLEIELPRNADAP